MSDLHFTFAARDGRTIEVRPATEADGEAYAALANATRNETTFLLMSPEDPPYRAERLAAFAKRMAESEMECILLALCDGEVIADTFVTGSTPAKLRHRCELSLEVRRDYWDLGVGSRLLNAILGFSREAGYEQMELEVVSTNERAIRLYHKNGFMETGRVPHGMKHAGGAYSDLIRMTKFL